MEYAIKYSRELNSTEIEILQKILSQEKSSFRHKIQQLKVVARCGCGKCPTILFGHNFEDEYLANQKILFDYIGRTIENELVGISIFGNEKIISELEFYSPDGNLEVITYPILESIKKIDTSANTR
jgi:hypothetical protein